MATLKATVTADISGFSAAMKKCQGIARNLAPVMTGIGVVAAGAMAAITAAAVGIKNALDIGGQLSELSARTGVAAGDLSVLQMAFERAGIGADSVGPMMNRMQKAIAGAGEGGKEAQDALARIGLSAQKLAGLSPDKQFAAIGKAIGSIPDPAAQAAASMAIFGKSGGQMLALFKDGGALGDAARAVGGQAAMLSKDANMFDRASDILNTSGNKLQGLFVGMADQIVPAIMPLLDELDGIDLSGMGQQIGRVVAIFIEGIKDGTIWSIMGQNALISLSNVVNFLWSGLMAIVKGVAQYVVEAVKMWITLFGVVTTADFWVGMVNTILGASMQFTGSMLSGAADFAQSILGALTGSAAAFMPLMQQVGKGVVTIFGVMTKPEFWAGLASALMGAAQKFRATILDAVATLLDKISSIPGLGIAAKGADSLRQQANKDRADAEQNAAVGDSMLAPIMSGLKDEFGKSLGVVQSAYAAGAVGAPDIASGMRKAGQQLTDRGAQASATGAQQLGPLIDRVTGQVTQGMTNIGEAVKDGWNQTAIDTSGMQASVAEGYAKLNAAVEANQAAAADKYKASTTQIPDGEGGGMADKAKFGPLFASSLAKIGGGGFAVGGGGNGLLDENRKQTGYLRKIANAIGGGATPALA